jgi:hypothetical protein
LGARRLQVNAEIGTGTLHLQAIFLIQSYNFSRVEEPRHFNPDPDPAFHFNPDPNPVPHQLGPMVDRPSWALFEHPGLHRKRPRPLRIQLFTTMPDPEPTSKTNADLCGKDPQP